MRPGRSGAALFAVGTSDAQVTWRALPAGQVTLRAEAPGVTAASLTHPGGPGAATIGGLSPGEAFALTVSASGRPGWAARLEGSTLPRPPGAETCRIATVSDLHIGEQAFGYLRTLTEAWTAEAYPVRCARAAMAEAAAWGAELLVVKGDAADQSHPELWEQTVELLAGAPMPVVVLAGNHERKRRRTVEVHTALRGTGITVVDRGLGVIDLPGVRLLLADTARHGRDVGSVSGFRTEALAAAATAPGAVLVLTHHHLARRPYVTQLPYGVPKREADRFLAALGRVNPSALVSSGHTHRNRRCRVGPVTVTTVGSVKDYPGVWAGYAVHEGGLVQTVRRIAEPGAVAWTDHSGRAVGGAYRWWTPGRLADRCFTLNW